MGDCISMNDMIGAASGDKNNMLGKLLYFSLSNILIEKDKLNELCDSLGIYHGGNRRVSVADAFKSATGDVRDRIVKTVGCQQQIYLVYCRDNRHSGQVLSRELVKETLNRETNQYEKLANISFDKTAASARTIWPMTATWTPPSTAGRRRSFSSSTRCAPTGSRWRPSASTSCAAWRPQK